MALADKKSLSRGRWVRINHGRSTGSGNELIQVVMVAPTTKEKKEINLGAARWQELADGLEAAAAALRSEFDGRVAPATKEVVKNTVLGGLTSRLRSRRKADQPG